MDKSLIVIAISDSSHLTCLLATQKINQSIATEKRGRSKQMLSPDSAKGKSHNRNHLCRHQKLKMVLSMQKLKGLLRVKTPRQRTLLASSMYQILCHLTQLQMRSVHEPANLWQQLFTCSVSKATRIYYDHTARYWQMFKQHLKTR